MVRLFVESINHQGEGIARNAGKVVFIPYAIPGETVEAIISEDKRKYSRGILQNIVLRSPHRVEAKCPYYYNCGGCSYQHINYSQQLLLKEKIVKDILKRIGGVSTSVKPVVGMSEPWYYRNKVIWHLIKSENKNRMGFYRFRTNELVDIDQCPLLLPELNEVSLIIKELLFELEVKEKSSIVIRQSNQPNNIMVEFINCIPREKLVNKLINKVQSIYIQNQGKLRLLMGKKEIVYKLGNYSFTLGPHDFFQINTIQSARLIDIVKEYLKCASFEKILDAFCGVGTFSLNVAYNVSQVIGIDSNHSAIKNARKNAKINGLGNCQFIAGFCEKIVPNLAIKFHKVIIDPPRAGLNLKFIDSIINIAPESIVYVSCSSATLARDIKQFIAHNYMLVEVQPLDMFAQTGNIENIALLQKV